MQSIQKDHWKYGGYKQFARKYMQIVDLISKEIELPPIMDYYDLERIPSGGDTLPFQQKEIFESVYANLSLLRAFLETKIGVVEDEILVRFAIFFNPGCGVLFSG